MAAAQIAEGLAGDASRLMDLAVCDWRDDEEWSGLGGHELLREAGYAFGAVELWGGKQLLHVTEAPFRPSELNQHHEQPRAPAPDPLDGAGSAP